MCTTPITTSLLFTTFNSYGGLAWGVSSSPHNNSIFLKRGEAPKKKKKFNRAREVHSITQKLSFIQTLDGRRRKSSGPRVAHSSSSSVGATTLGGFWPALRFRFTIFYLYTSLSSFSLSSSLNPLLPGQAISILVFLLLLMNMVPFS